MKVLLDVSIPHEPFNTLLREGKVGEKLNRILESIKPDSVYFSEHAGKRGATLVVDLPDASRIPALAEPWFLTFNADVHFRVAMSPEDLKTAGLEELGKRWA